jgi:hypothetical protein
MNCWAAMATPLAIVSKSCCATMSGIWNAVSFALRASDE